MMKEWCMVQDAAPKTSFDSGKKDKFLVETVQFEDKSKITEFILKKSNRSEAKCFDYIQNKVVWSLKDRTYRNQIEQDFGISIFAKRRELNQDFINDRKKAGKQIKYKRSFVTGNAESN